MSCERRRLESCPARLRLMGWAAPEGTAHVVCRGYLGSYPPQLVPKHLVPIVQRCLELVRAGANKLSSQTRGPTTVMSCRVIVNRHRAVVKRRRVV